MQNHLLSQNTSINLNISAGWHILAILSLLSCFGCGPNTFKSLEQEDPAEDATVALENNEPEKAIKILTDALEDEPNNEQYISILGLAYAQRAGVDPLTLAERMGSSSSSSTSSSSSNGLTSMFSYMPDATDANIADVDLAISTLLRIPGANFKSYDILKLAIFQTAAMVLRAKALDTDGDGQLSTDEILAMSAESALAIITQLASAAATFSGGSENGVSSTTEAASQQITKIQTAIDSSEGSDSAEKLKNYLGKSGT